MNPNPISKTLLLTWDKTLAHEAAQRNSEILQSLDIRNTDQIYEVVVSAYNAGQKDLASKVINKYSSQERKHELDGLLDRFVLLKDQSLIHFALEHGLSATDNNSSALRTSIGIGQLKIAQILCNAGGEAFAINGVALVQAAGQGHLQTIQYFLTNKQLGKTAERTKAPNLDLLINAAFINAAGNGHTSIMLFFISQNFSVRQAFKESMNIAVINGQKASVELLLNKGVTTKVLQDSLALAAGKGRAEITAALLNKGAQISWQDYEALKQSVQSANSGTPALRIMLDFQPDLLTKAAAFITDTPEISESARAEVTHRLLQNQKPNTATIKKSSSPRL